jgi:hypothetical protein
MHKNLRILIALIVLLSASLACQTLAGGEVPKAPVPTKSSGQPPAGGEAPATATMPPQQTEIPTAGSGSGDVKTDFPMPADAINITDMGSDMLNFQTKLSLKEVIACYRDAFGKEGYKEREIQTTITEAVFSMVFDGHASGKAIVIQGVDMGNGTVNVNITLQDL